MKNIPPRPFMLRLMHHRDHATDPITELHCFIVKYKDGHEEIVMHIEGERVGPSMGRQPLESKHEIVRKALGDLPVASVRLASFIAI